MLHGGGQGGGGVHPVPLLRARGPGRERAEVRRGGGPKGEGWDGGAGTAMALGYHSGVLPLRSALKERPAVAGQPTAVAGQPTAVAG